MQTSFFILPTPFPWLIWTPNYCILSRPLNVPYIASKIVDVLNANKDFVNVNIAGPGFINITFSNDSLVKYLNDISKNIKININKYDKKKIFLDYGGANVAKVLHVGHLRSANIGEALKRLCNLVGYDTISDVHLGDFGRPLD